MTTTATASATDPWVPGRVIDVSQLDAKQFDPARNKFKLPESAEGVWLITSTHPLSEHLVRVDEIGELERAAYRAEIMALGYRVAEERPLGARRAVPPTFPRSAIGDHPAAVNQLLAIDRAIAREQATVADKPGRAETNFYALLPQLKKLGSDLVLPFYDRLIDVYLDAGNEHYANRQAKLALGLLGKNAQAWLVARVRTLLDRRFYSTLLVDAALAATVKVSAKAALDLHIEIFERVLRSGIKPYKGLLAGLVKRATAAKATARIDGLLAAHVADAHLLANPTHGELRAIFDGALAVVDRLPERDRLARLQAIAAMALSDDGDVVHRATAWDALTARLGELPALTNDVISLAFRICKNIQISYEDEGNGIGKEFRARVGQFLQTLPPDTLAARFDDWAAVLDDYDDWARAWFYDTFLTLEELLPTHPTVFDHDGIARAVIKGLLLGVVYAGNHDEFLDKLQDFIDRPGRARHVEVSAVVALALELIDRDRAGDLTAVFEKLALHARDKLQQIAIELARAAVARGLRGTAALELIGNHARWLTADSRTAIREAIATSDPWPLFVDAALASGATLTAPTLWMDVAAAQLSDFRSMIHDHCVSDGKRWAMVGRSDYKGVLSVVVDGERVFRLENQWGGETYQTARFREVAGALRILILFGDDDDQAWKLRTSDPDGQHPTEVELGAWKRCLFARHAPWIVALSEERVAVFDLDGSRLAEHELALEHVGDARDFFKVVHPLRDHFVVAGKTATLVFARDPVQPIRIERAINGTLYRGGQLLFECRSGKTAELVDVHGRIVQTLARPVTGSLCGQCDEIHTSEYQPTNVRGVDGEVLAQEDKKYHQLQTADNAVTGRVPFDFESNYYLDMKAVDLDGDGFDELWYLDYVRGRLIFVRDPAAPLRAAIARHGDELRTLARTPLTLSPGRSSDDVANYLAQVVDRAPAEARDGLRAGELDAARAAVTTHHGAIERTYQALASQPESWPTATVSNRVRLPSSELARLKTTYFERPLDDYPMARALEFASLEGYDKLWCRDGFPAGPDMAFLRTLIHAHLQIARERGLDPKIRGRALEVVELLVARSEAPDVQLMLSANEAGDGYFRISSADSTEVVTTRTITPSLAQLLADHEKPRGVSGFTYRVCEQRRGSIGDVAINGTLALGAARLDLWFHLDAGETLVHEEEPELTGPVDAVIAARATLAKVTQFDQAHEGVPTKVWPDGAHEWAPLDEWMLAEERAGVRREIAALRALPPDQSTVGRAAHRAVIATMANRYAIDDDTAGLLCAMILSRKFDRGDLAKWAGIKADALLKHFKALIAAGLVRAHEREYVLDVPVVEARWGTPEPAFHRVFWTAAHSNREHQVRCELRFSEADVLAAFVTHVAGGAKPAAKSTTKKSARR